MHDVRATNRHEGGQQDTHSSILGQDTKGGKGFAGKFLALFDRFAPFLVRSAQLILSDVPKALVHSEPDIAKQIVIVRGTRVLLDATLACLYSVSTRRLNEAVKRNAARFPSDFIFRLSSAEHRLLMSQIATSKPGRGGRRKLPLVFTEHGAIMTATILNSPRAVAMSVYVVRAFVRLRAIMASQPDLMRKLDALERSLTSLDERTRRQFAEVYSAIRALMAPPTARSRPIGFTADLDEG